jgi:hypothetical protein
VIGSGGELPALSRRRFLSVSGAGALVVFAGGGLLAPASAQASPRDDPYDIATWEALAGARLTLRTASEERAVVAGPPLKGAGRAYSVVLGPEATLGHAEALHDGTYVLEHERTGRFPLFVVDGGPGRYVATFNN